MRQIVILASGFVNPQTGQQNIGGVQTYISDIVNLSRKLGYDTIVYQFNRGCESKEYQLGNGVLCKIINTDNYQKSFETLFVKYNKKETIFIVSTDQMDIKSKESNVIAIQHGIAFDIPGNLITGFWGKTKTLQRINKLLRCIRNTRRFFNVKNTVCVDYNFYNWFRTLDSVSDSQNVWVVPNYSSSQMSLSDFEAKCRKSTDIKKIVFARRFVEHRGSLIFASVIKKLIDEGFNIDVTFAGGGPCLLEMQEMLKGYHNIHFTSYEATESVAFHSSFDVAVVPTIFSEGTSLSLCEAMAAGCFPISTCVGGLSNILIDHFNGLLCMPTTDSLYLCLKEMLLMDFEDFVRIQTMAYNTAATAFSHGMWENKWTHIISKTYELINL